ncbi:integration host factor [Streptomyces sp. NBC_01619]|uniref:integration host factor, actinobacterial type n=1 Tax=Streptomyces sp. NBC_01619 TaxID=2975901 RepID=UPI002252EE9C|nr:integration host factor, actinobacterial type [Streptomyces sp. NBC_01619]MCX4515871.1 integration host factor [Streptomyces sp. NBC_01619]
MALPPLTQEERAQALAKAVTIRKERAALLAKLKNGTTPLEDVLQRKDQVVARMHVRRLLQAQPGIGPIRADQLLDELRISPGRRVRGLGLRQKAALLQRFPARS